MWLDYAKSAAMSPVTISTFYHFAPIDAPENRKADVLTRMQQLGVKGTITLSPEGINATISGTMGALEAMKQYLREWHGFAGLQDKISRYARQPFRKSKVKVKRELISLGVAAHPSVCVGEYVPPAKWNALITRDDVMTIDTRNSYEYRIGHFAGAINPNTHDFKDMVAFTQTHLDPKTHPHVAMYCTGGIRCEKYSSYLVRQGFERVYHLQGGILAYLEHIPVTESLWKGDCFVFDERVAVGHGLVANPDATMCLGCGNPLYSSDREHSCYVEGARCRYCEPESAA
jgi:UPF0176 protein